MSGERHPVDIKLIGIALSLNPLAWRLGWRTPAKDDGAWGGPAEGDWWLCLGPLCLMYEERV